MHQVFLVKYDVKVPNFTNNSTPEEFAYTWQSKLVGIIAIKTENREFTTFTRTKIHLFCPPKFCISVVFNFSWVLQPSLEKSNTMVMQNLKGVNKMHHGLCANGGCTSTWRFADVTVLGKMLVNNLPKHSSSQVDTGHVTFIVYEGFEFHHFFLLPSGPTRFFNCGLLLLPLLHFINH